MDTMCGQGGITHVRNNIILNTDAHGIFADDFNGRIYNNTICHVDSNGILVDNFSLGDQDDEIVLSNNIIQDYGNYGVCNLSPTLVYDIYNSLIFRSDSTNEVYDMDVYDCIYDNDAKFGFENDTITSPESPYDYFLAFNSPALHAGSDTVAVSTGENVNGSYIDIGAYGGIYSKEYFVNILNELDNGDTLTEYNSPYKVVEDINISNADTVVMIAYDDEMIICNEEDVEITVEGVLKAIGVNTNKVVMTCKDTTALWEGIYMEGQSYLETENIEISYANNGVTICDTAHVQLYRGNINNILYNGVESTTKYIYNNEISEMIIENCDVGVTVTGTKEVNIDNSTIRNCNEGVKYKNTVSGAIKMTTIEDIDEIGLSINNSSPYVYYNIIRNNGYNGIALLAGSDIDIGVPSDTMGNYIGGNGQDGNTSMETRAEIYLNKSKPYFKYCHNDIVDTTFGADTTYKNLYSEDATQYAGDGNYWAGRHPNPDRWFYPNGCVSGQISWDASQNRTFTVDTYYMAWLHEQNGEYEEAKDIYYDLVENEGMSNALKRWIICNQRIGTSNMDIIMQLEIWETNDAVENSAFWAKIVIQNESGEFETSIEQLEDFIDISESENDSLLGVLQELITYYQMALAEDDGNGVLSAPSDRVDDRHQPFGLQQVGRYTYPVPANEADFEQKESELMLAIQGYGSRAGRKQDGLPREFEMAAAYPNPFNPTVSIPVALPKTTEVRLSVFNVLGQRVATLVDERMNAGRHSVMWNGQSDASLPVSSGVYFVTMEAGGFVKTQKLVLMK